MTDIDRIREALTHYWDRPNPDHVAAFDALVARLEAAEAVATAAEDLVAWADEQEAMTGYDSLDSLRLRIERLRNAVRSQETGQP